MLDKVLALDERADCVQTGLVNFSRKFRDSVQVLGVTFEMDHSSGPKETPEKVPTPEEVVQAFTDSASDVAKLTVNLTSLIEKTDNFDKEVQQITQRSQVVHLLINEAKMTATLMHEWGKLLKKMLPQIKLQQYLVPPIDIFTVKFFKYTKLGVGIAYVFVGGWMVLAKEMLFKTFAKYFGIIMFALGIVQDIIAAIEKAAKFANINDELDKCKVNVDSSNEQLKTAEHDLTEFYATVKNLLVTAGFNDDHTLDPAGAGPSTINSVLAKSIKSFGQDKGKIEVLQNFAEDDLLELAAELAKGTTLTQEQLFYYAKVVKKTVEKGLKDSEDGKIQYSEFDRKSAFVVLFTIYKIPADVIKQLLEAANYTITKEEYLKMLAREMLETEADPATLKDRLKKLGLTDAEIKAIMDDIEAQRQAMQGGFKGRTQDAPPATQRKVQGNGCREEMISREIKLTLLWTNNSQFYFQ
ncbi:hypothetical protein FGO68_gene32 [Halteria grandinella]|uniref:Uncharacterized protein n=1 Tax=Halteria grandinella TaxID=5974 RepID=A0A8J8T855_HALGN|nr:hypothetical protein FGO68_gene32 [Halteria grandinella]